MRERQNLFSSVSEKIPSPEELFGDSGFGNERLQEAFSTARQKPIPGYEIAKRSRMIFYIILILLVLFAVNFDKLGIRFYVMNSSSMGSAVPEGSVFMTRKIPFDKLSVGDIIAYSSKEGKTVTDQIEAITPVYNNGQLGYRTKGPAHLSPEERTISYKDVYGKAIFYIPYIGNLFRKNE